MQANRQDSLKSCLYGVAQPLVRDLVVSGGFTVVPGALHAGSAQFSGLREDVSKAGSDAAAALIGAADACGNGQVQAALSSLAKATMQRFMDAMAGSQYTADGLAKAAGNYQRAENAAAQAAQAVRPPLEPGARLPLGELLG
jgi:hypothetical protein